MKHGYLKYCSLYKRWSTFGCKQKRFHLSITFWYIVIDFHVYCDRDQPVFRFRWVDFCNVNSTCLIFCLHLSKLLFDRCVWDELWNLMATPPLMEKQILLRSQWSITFVHMRGKYVLCRKLYTNTFLFHTYTHEHIFIHTYTCVRVMLCRVF